jgi:hypothetical protein
MNVMNIIFHFSFVIEHSMPSPTIGGQAQPEHSHRIEVVRLGIYADEHGVSVPETISLEYWDRHAWQYHPLYTGFNRSHSRCV